ncbi:MAG TPA: ABC transporter permease [Gaiellaceae bacterium]|nr:ABC transporter permease [Gaiellaceae bacterium]
MSAAADVDRRPSNVVIIRPAQGIRRLRLGELWPNRELFAFLVWRDLKVRYAQTALGATWTVFQPLALMGVYTYAFTQLARFSSAGVPYPLFALSGLVLWIFISRAVVQGSLSLLTEIPIVKKTSAPRLLIPLASITAMLVDFAISVALFFIFAGIYGRAPGARALAIFPILLVMLTLTYGLALLLSALNVRYRDVAQILPFVIQLWFFLSPVAYSLRTPGLSLLTLVQAINPLVGLTEAVRWALIGAPAPHGLLAIAVVESLALLALGLFQFSRVERTIADEV